MSRTAATRILLFVGPVLALLALFAALVAADRISHGGRGRAYVIRLELPPGDRELGLPRVEGPLDASRPLVVIDAGHGGHDPGAGNGVTREKDVTLALAEALKKVLLEQGDIRVALTRDTDRFLMLPERSGIARRLRADLFISIHADSADNAEASGATVYTLSDRGSSDEAARLAASENNADTVNGVLLREQASPVSAILVDLAQRETTARSEEFSRLVLREGQGTLRFRERGMQSAAFVVLKSADLPSVLFEAGYISNVADAAWLDSPAGREGFAAVTARAIRIYFARQAGLPTN